VYLGTTPLRKTPIRLISIGGRSSTVHAWTRLIARAPANNLGVLSSPAPRGQRIAGLFMPSLLSLISCVQPRSSREGPGSPGIIGPHRQSVASARCDRHHLADFRLAQARHHPPPHSFSRPKCAMFVVPLPNVLLSVPDTPNSRDLQSPEWAPAQAGYVRGVTFKASSS
jgi:hypothetical protein